MRVTSQPMSKQAVESGSKLVGKCSGVSMIEAVAYVQPLNPSPDPKDWCIAFNITMKMDEEDWAEEGGKASSMQPAFKCLCSFDFERKDEQNFK